MGTADSKPTKDGVNAPSSPSNPAKPHNGSSSSTPAHSAAPKEEKEKEKERDKDSLDTFFGFENVPRPFVVLLCPFCDVCILSMIHTVLY